MPKPTNLKTDTGTGNKQTNNTKKVVSNTTKTVTKNTSKIAGTKPKTVSTAKTNALNKRASLTAPKREVDTPKEKPDTQEFVPQVTNPNSNASFADKDAPHWNTNVSQQESLDYIKSQQQAKNPESLSYLSADEKKEVEKQKKQIEEKKAQASYKSLDKQIADTNKDGDLTMNDVVSLNEKTKQYEFVDYATGIKDLNAQKKNYEDQRKTLRSDYQNPLSQYGVQTANHDEEITLLNNQIADIDAQIAELERKQRYQNAVASKYALDKAVQDGDSETIDALYNQHASYDDPWIVKRAENLFKIPVDMISAVGTTIDIIRDIGGEHVAKAMENDAKYLREKGEISDEKFNEMLDTAKKYADFDALNPDSYAGQLRQVSNQMAYEIANGQDGIGKFIGEGLDSTANFIAQFMILGETGSLAMMSTQSATQKYIENIEKGYSQDVALANAVATGLISYATEKIGMDNFVAILNGTTGKTMLSQIVDKIIKGEGNWQIVADAMLSQGLAEGLEEVAEGNADYVLDNITAMIHSGEPVPYNAGDIFYAMMVGAFSGGITGAFGGTYSIAVDTRAQYNALKNDVNSLINARNEAVMKGEDITELNSAIATGEMALNNFEQVSTTVDSVALPEDLVNTDLDTQGVNEEATKIVEPNVANAVEQSLKNEALIDSVNNTAQQFLAYKGIDMSVDEFVSMDAEARNHLTQNAEAIRQAFPNANISYSTELFDKNGNRVNAKVRIVNGKPIIVVDPTGDTSVVVSAVHEMIHTIEGTPEYAEIVNTIFPKGDKRYLEKVNELLEGRYSGDTLSTVGKEAVTIAITEDLMKEEGSQSFIEHMAKYNTSTAYKLWYQFKNVSGLFADNSEIGKITSMLTNALASQDMFYTQDGIAFNRKKTFTTQAIDLFRRFEEGEINAKTAMKYFVPLSRVEFDDKIIRIDFNRWEKDLGLNNYPPTASFDTLVHSQYDSEDPSTKKYATPGHTTTGKTAIERWVTENLNVLYREPYAIFENYNPKDGEIKYILALKATDRKGIPIILSVSPGDGSVRVSFTTENDRKVSYYTNRSTGYFSKNGIYDNRGNVDPTLFLNKLKLVWTERDGLASKNPNVNRTQKNQVLRDVGNLQRNANGHTLVDPSIIQSFDKNKQYENLNEIEQQGPFKSARGIHTFEETLNDGNVRLAEDFTQDDLDRALKNKYIRVYSDSPIKTGTRVTPSRNEISPTASEVYDLVVKTKNVAWKDNLDGIYAPLESEYNPEKYVTGRKHLDENDPLHVAGAKAIFNSENTKGRFKNDEYEDILGNINNEKDYVYYYNLHQDTERNKVNWRDRQRSTTKALSEMFGFPVVDIDLAHIKERKYKVLGDVILNPGEKSQNSAETKVMKKRTKSKDYNLDSIKDHNRWTIQVKDASNIPEIIKKLQERFGDINLEIKNGREQIAFKDGDYQIEMLPEGDNYGYIGFHATWRDGFGINNEIQISPDFDLKVMSDSLYEKWRRKDYNKLTEEEIEEFKADRNQSKRLWNSFGDGIIPSVISNIFSSETGREYPGFISQGDNSLTQDLVDESNSPMTQELSDNNNVGVSSSNTIDNPLGNDNISVPPLSDNIISQSETPDEGTEQEEKEQYSRRKNVDPDKFDNKGNPISPGQAKYFEKSYVRGSYGGLLRMYHGTDSPLFTIFDRNMSDDKRSLFFTDDPRIASTYINKKFNKGMEYAPDRENSDGKQQRVYSTYLNITNPLIIDGDGENWDRINPFYLNANAKKYNFFTTIEDYNNFLKDEGLDNYRVNDGGNIEAYRNGKWVRLLASARADSQTPLNFFRSLDRLANTDYRNTMYDHIPGKWHLDTRAIAEFAENNGYDGVILRNTYDTSNYDIYSQPSTIAIVFDSNQVKSTNNLNPTEDPDIMYSRRKNLDTQQETVGGEETQSGVSNQYFDYGMNPARNVNVPRETKYGPTRRHANNMANSEWVSDEEAQRIVKAVEDGDYAYAPVVFKEVDAEAKNKLKKQGFDKSYKEVISDLDDITLEKVALARQVLNQMRIDGKEGTPEYERLQKINASFFTPSAQITAYARHLRQSTPDGQIITIESEIARVQSELRERWGDKTPELTIPNELREEYLNEKTTEERRQEIREEIAKNIADKIPPTALEQINSFRHLAMLFNPRTWMKNKVSNKVFGWVDEGTRAVRSFLETLAKEYGDKHENSIFHGMEKEAGIYNRLSETDRAWKKQFEKDYVDNYKKGISKYSDMDIGTMLASTEFGKLVEENRKTFNSKILNALNDFNFNSKWALSDAPAMKDAYSKAMVGWFKAKNLTPETVTEAQMKQAREFAYNEALYATFNTNNWLANQITRFEREADKKKVGTVTRMAVESFIPFKRTPLNIIRTGYNYTPVGLATNLARDLYLVKKGNMTANQLINHMAQGLTGSGLVALGALLASMGIFRTKDDDKDRKQYYDESLGEQDYALVFDGGTYTIEWLDPMIVPIAIGAEIFKAFQTHDMSLENISNVIASVADPIFETSMLSGISKNLSSYNADDPVKYWGEIGKNMLTNYASQYYPSVFGAVARTIDDTRRSTYGRTSLERTASKTLNKIPYFSTKNEPYINKKGEVQKNEDLGIGLPGRAVLNFLSPGYYSSNKIDEYDEELYRLYDETGELDVLPSSATQDVTFQKEKMEFSPHEYAEWHKTRWATETKYVDQFIDSSAYKTMSDEDKAKTIKDIRTYAREVAKKEFLESRGKEYNEKSLTKPQGALDNGIELYEYYDYENNAGKKQAEKVEYLEDSNLTQKQKEYLFGLEGYKKSYQEAYEKAMGKDETKSKSKKKTSKKSSKKSSASSGGGGSSTSKSKTRRFTIGKAKLPTTSTKVSPSVKKTNNAYLNAYSNRMANSNAPSAVASTTVCPRCGNRVTSQNGRCPICGARL